MLYTKVMIAVFTLMALFACIKPSHSTNLIRVLASAAPPPQHDLNLMLTSAAPPTTQHKFDADFRRCPHYTTLEILMIDDWWLYIDYEKFWLYIDYEKFWRLMIIDNWNFIKKVVCNVAKSWKPYKSRVCRGCKWCCKSGFWRAQKICNRKS